MAIMLLEENKMVETILCLFNIYLKLKTKPEKSIQETKRIFEKIFVKGENEENTQHFSHSIENDKNFKTSTK